IGDICGGFDGYFDQGQMLGFRIQKQWSNGADKCVLERDIALPPGGGCPATTHPQGGLCVPDVPASCSSMGAASALALLGAMALGLTLGALAMVHLALARAPWHIAAAALLLGLLGDLYRPAVWAAASDLVPPEHRLRAFGFLYWAINLGFAIAAALAGALASSGYWILFAGDAATSLAMAALVWTRVPETRPERRDDAGQPGTAALDFLAPFG